MSNTTNQTASTGLFLGLEMGQIEYFAEKNTQRQKQMFGKLDAFLSTFRAQSNLFLLSMWVMTD